MEPEGSLPHSQVPATCPYPGPAQSSEYPTSHFPQIHLDHSQYSPELHQMQHTALRYGLCFRFLWTEQQLSALHRRHYKPYWP